MMKKNKLLATSGTFFLGTIFTIYLLLVIKTNLNFVDFLPGMVVDEINDMSIIKKVHAMQSFSDFWDLFFVTDPEGGIHGFVTFYIPALLGWIPQLFFGDGGALFAYRMSSALFLMSSYLLFSIYYGFSTISRNLFFILLLLFPFTVFFCIIGRCESYMFFFFALFLVIQKRKDWSSSWVFLFLGLSLASRIAIAPYLLVSVLVFAVKNFQRNSIFAKKMLKACIALMLGFFIGGPHNINLYQWVMRKKFLIFSDTGNRTFVDYDYWLGQFVLKYALSSIVLYLAIGLVFAIAVCYLWKILKVKDSASRMLFFSANSSLLIDLLFAVAGIFGLLAVMNTVKIHATGWYVHHHLIFLFLGLLSIIGRMKFKAISDKWLGALLMVVVAVYAIFRLEVSPFFVGGSYTFTDSINRENQPHQLLKRDDYSKMVNLFEDITKQNGGKKLYFSMMSDHFLVPSTDQYWVQPNWSAAPFYKYTEYPYDGIVFNFKDYDPAKLHVPKEHGEYQMRENGIENYRKWVVPKWGGKCLNKVCLDAIEIRSGLYLFLRTDVKYQKGKL